MLAVATVLAVASVLAVATVLAVASVLAVATVGTVWEYIYFVVVLITLGMEQWFGSFAVVGIVPIFVVGIEGPIPGCKVADFAALLLAEREAAGHRPSVVPASASLSDNCFVSANDSE